MLLDTEMTMTNSPGTSPSQVSIVINNAIKKKMDGDKRNVQQMHQTEQQIKFARVKLTNCLNLRSQSLSVSLGASNENEDTSKQKIDTKKPNLKFKSTGMHFYPYADENDTYPKNLNVNCSRLRSNTSYMMTDIVNKPRFFGNDRSNQMQRSTRSQNMINLRRENFQNINISNNMIMKSSSTLLSEGHQNSQLNEENAVMFRNYDLNDDFWFNFE